MAGPSQKFGFLSRPRAEFYTNAEFKLTFTMPPAAVSLCSVLGHLRQIRIRWKKQFSLSSSWTDSRPRALCGWEHLQRRRPPQQRRSSFPGCSSLQRCSSSPVACFPCLQQAGPYQISDQFLHALEPSPRAVLRRRQVQALHRQGSVFLDPRRPRVGPTVVLGQSQEQGDFLVQSFWKIFAD